MLAALFERGGEGEKRALRHALGGEHVGHARLALGDRAGFIQRDDLGLAGFFERNGSLEQNPVFRAKAVADHDGHRRGQPQRTRAADDQHGDAARERKADGLAAEQPDGGGQDGERDHRRHEHAGNPVGDLRNRRFRRGGVGDHFDDLGEGRVLADARCLAAQEAGLIRRRGGDAVPDGLIHRDALAGQRGFVHRALALQNHAVHRDAFAGADDEHIAAPHLRNRHGDFLPAAHECCGLRGELHQAAERVGRFALGARFQHFADGNQRQNHRRRFEVELVHILHDGRRVAAHLRARHGEKGVGAVTKGRGRAQRDERIHIRRAVEERAESVDEEFLVDDHDGDGQQHLEQPHCDVVIRKAGGQRPAPHHVPHRDIHQRKQKAQRRDQAALERRGFAVGQRVLLRGGGRRTGRALERRAVARRLHSGNDGLSRSRAFHAHGVGEQADRAARHARHGGNGLFHTGTASRAAHARYGILFHR